MDQALSPATLRKVPPEMDHAVSLRSAWSWCALERSLIGPVWFEGDGVPFHHLGLPLDGLALRAGLRVDGRRQDATMRRDELMVVAAGDGGAFWWDRPMDCACFYFTDAALGAALGRDVGLDAHVIRTIASRHAPVVARLLRALHADAEARHPHGVLAGDAIFLALAAQLVPPGTVSHEPLVATVADRRVRRALDYIHAHLGEAIDIASIASASATSPFHLSRCFHAAVGCSIWQYVLHERARSAFVLMRDASLPLAAVAQRAGFDTYAGFVSAMRREFGAAPAELRARAAA